MKHIKAYFITGFLVAVPLYITVYVLTLIVGFMDNVFNILPPVLRPNTYLTVHIPGLGILFTIAGIFIIGLLTQNLIGKRLLGYAEKLLGRIPVVSIVYNGTKQFMETFFAKENQGLRKVVLVEFPRKGVYSIGFVTSKTRGEVKDKTEEGTVNVFLPTTPNPTSGFYMIFTESDVVPLEMKVEDAFKVIMTGGLVVPNGENFKAANLQKARLPVTKN